MNSFVQIIGGVYRGKKIYFPDAPDLRPTPSRVRETLFNWLMHDIRGAICLDAFAGSGALGFEAISRGALQVDFVEQNNLAYQQLKKNFFSLKVASGQCWHTDTLSYLKKEPQIYDIIFLDPPFNGGHLQQAIAHLTHNCCLKNEGLLYVESAEKPLFCEKSWTLLKYKKAGQVNYSLYRKNGI